jgi:Tubulin like
VALVTANATFDSVRSHYAFWTAGIMVSAYAVGALALACFAGAVRDWPMPLAGGGYRRRQAAGPEATPTLVLGDASADGEGKVPASAHGQRGTPAAVAEYAPGSPRNESAGFAAGSAVGAKSGEDATLDAHDVLVADGFPDMSRSGIHRPVLFVGLGGTGLRIGAELERQLRCLLCGPDGTALMSIGIPGLLPYQLPSCLQFIYADMDETDLRELRRQAAPPVADKRAVSRTTRIMPISLPMRHDSVQVVHYLRSSAMAQVGVWLPSPDRAPNVGPLSHGAGQLPTVARAVLFDGVAARGIDAAERPIVDAVDALRACGAELAALGGDSPPVACDVFVAFSVAGGTGTGIFYDYLHLIADAFEGSGIHIQIHPLVVMPSAFAQGRGGGEDAVLNAGQALVDLFRLVDDQNTRGHDRVFGPAEGSVPGVSVTYPGGRTVRISPSTIQTAFLFSRTAGLEPADLDRSVVSFILAMAGETYSGADQQPAGASAARLSFLNRGVSRQTFVPSGIGSRGASTVAVASLTVPRSEIFGILAAHLLSSAVSAADRPGSGEDNSLLIGEFLIAAGLEALCQRPEAPAPRIANRAGGSAGADAVRLAAYQLGELLSDEKVPKIAAEFSPDAGLKAMLKLAVDGTGPVDLFRAERALFGQGGVLDILRSKAERVHVPAGPPAEDSDGQDQWMELKTASLWHKAWAAQRPVWEPKLERLRAELDALTGVLRDHRDTEMQSFAPRVENLYTKRVAALYLLPRPSHDADDFYSRLTSQLPGSPGLEPLRLAGLLGDNLWQRFADRSADSPADKLVYFEKLIGERLRNRIGDGVSGLPMLADLLASAAGESDKVPGNDRERFRGMLRGLIPAGAMGLRVLERESLLCRIRGLGNNPRQREMLNVDRAAAGRPQRNRPRHHPARAPSPGRKYRRTGRSGDTGRGAGRRRPQAPVPGRRVTFPVQLADAFAFHPVTGDRLAS